MRWRFGIGQSTREEREEIERAKLAGLVDEYLNGQRCSRLIEAENQRRRRREHKRSGDTCRDHEALLVNGGGIDAGAGTFFANYGEDVHAVGLLDPIVPGHVGCIVIRPDGSRRLARAVPDPLAE